jgi:glutamate dehydrogenase/leucine dehydrogenase
VNERLQEVLLDNFTVLREIAAARGISYRTAAYMVAIDRVVKSLKARGVYA